MTPKKVDLKIPYGKKYLNFSLPEGRFLGVLQNKRSKGCGTRKLLSDSLAAPLGSDRLEDIVRGSRKILIVVPDSTRSGHLRDILPELLKRTFDGNRAVDIIIATGLHKKHTAKQFNELLGERVVRKCRVTSHEQSAENLVRLGDTSGGVPIVLNSNIRSHDFIISIGVIEPHLYAGYSGGVKTVAIGLAGKDTINATHSINFLDKPGTKIGSIKANPFQQALQEIALKAPVRFAVNIVNDQAGIPVKIFSGDVRKVFEKGVNFAKKIFEVHAPRECDVIICGIGYPKDINLYQASRALNYIVDVDEPVIKKGGLIIVAAELKEEFGDSLTEERFYNELKSISSPERFVANIRKKGCVAGEHRAYMVARVLCDYKVAFVTSGEKDFMKALPFPYFKDVADALRYADSLSGKGFKIYVVPKALSTIARLNRRPV